jgi:uncharacterized LabA/DUF88 family protein
MRAMAAEMVRLPHVLVGTKYFTARVSGARQGDSPEKAAERERGRLRQNIFLEALETLESLQIYEGHYLLKRDHCRECKKEYYRPEEKMTDVCIATEMVADAFLDRFDSALVVSGDGDLVPPIQAIKLHFPHKRVIVAFPPRRKSLHLTALADATFSIWERTFTKCQLPEAITKHDGTVLTRPTEWQ